MVVIPLDIGQVMTSKGQADGMLVLDYCWFVGMLTDIITVYWKIRLLLGGFTTKCVISTVFQIVDFLSSLYSKLNTEVGKN